MLNGFCLTDYERYLIKKTPTGPEDYPSTIICRWTCHICNLVIILESKPQSKTFLIVKSKHQLITGFINIITMHTDFFLC